MKVKFTASIGTEDLFKILIHKVPNFYMEAERYTLQTDQQEYKPFCLFKESVKVLAALEKFVTDLTEGTLPEVDIEIFKSKHLSQNIEYLKYFDDLKFQEGMFDTTFLQLSQNWLRYINFLTNDREGIELYQNTEFIKTVPSINSNGQPDFTRQWDPWKFSRAKAIRLQHNFLKSLDEYPEKSEFRQNLLKAYEQFDALLLKYNKLYTFAVDLRFVRRVDPVNREPLDTFLEQVLKDRETIQFFIIQQLPEVVQTYTKLEHDFKNGLKLSCIFICQSSIAIREKMLMNELEENLRQKFQQYHIEVINSNKIIKKHADEQAIGLIQRKNNEQVNLFKYWVLSYFYRIDSFVKLIHPITSFEVNNSLESPIRKVLEQNTLIEGMKKEKKLVTFADLLKKWSAPAAIWRLSYVPKRLSISQIFYKELCIELGAPHYGELLYQIQVLIETMLKKNDLAFNIFHKDGQTIINKQELTDRSTVLGQQFLFIVKQLSSLPNAPWVLANLCEQIKRGLGLEEIKIFISNLLYIFHIAYLSQPLLLSSLEQFNQTLLAIRQQIILSRGSDVNYKNKYQASYDLFARRQNEAIKYIGSVMEQNCFAYRLVIQADIDSHNFKQAEFSKLFTDFMRFAKRAKPCSWLRGYMGIWQENIVSSKCEIDVILFFNEKCHPEKEKVVDMLHTRWQKFLNEKAKKFLKWETDKTKKELKFYGSISSKVLMHSIDVFNKKEHHTQGVYLEASDLVMKNLFLEQVIPFFAYRDFFRPALSERIPKTFIKGSLGKVESA